MHRTALAVLTGLVAAPLASIALAAPASAHVPGVTVGPVKAGCSDAAVQNVRRNARGQVVEQYVLRATVTSPTAHTHVVDRKLRASDRHGNLTPYRVVERNKKIACGKGSGSSAISGTVSGGAAKAALGVAWKARTTTATASATDLTLPQAALDHGNAPNRNPNLGADATPILALGHDWT